MVIIFVICKMGKKKSGGGGYGRRGDRIQHRDERAINEAERSGVDFAINEGNVDDDDDGDGEEEEEEEDIDEDIDEDGGKKRPQLTVSVCMWEFGQNDPKRDSGSKLCRLGYASKLRIGQSFPGVVLSSEAKVVVSPADADIVQKFGIGGINCSWNRLGEIPFGSMGKGRNQRILPLLFAANSVNYGRPFKMNTAEAMAACLYIVGFKDDAKALLSPFGYGPEFIRLNFEALEAYSSCTDAAGVDALGIDLTNKVAYPTYQKSSAASAGMHVGLTYRIK